MFVGACIDCVLNPSKNQMNIANNNFQKAGQECLIGISYQKFKSHRQVHWKNGFRYKVFDNGDDD